MVDWIETHISVIGTGISIGVLIVSLGTFVLLIINAVLIWRYVKETKRQADAATDIARASRAEFEPNVQITLTTSEKRSTSFYRWPPTTKTDKGLIIDNEGNLLIGADFINLSKGVTNFWLELSEFNTCISTMVGKIRLIPNELSWQDISPLTLKPNEIIDGTLIFDLERSFDESQKSFTNLDILNGGYLSISYRTAYPSNLEPFWEYWAYVIDNVVRLDNNEYVLAGNWSNVYRSYVEDFPIRGSSNLENS